MISVRTVDELRSALAEPRHAGLRIGLVPTMGAFHDGHLSLMRLAREQCDLVVVSLFVNPAQFGDTSDLEAYPRDELRDASLAREVGVDVLFTPSVHEVYPAGFSTTVSVAGVTERLEGEHRGRAHFDGVATVVVKLLNMCAPDVAYFGQKDAQQALVIRRLVRDLDLPVRIETAPTVRDPDGVALSSRNAHLSPPDRVRAQALSGALRAIQAAVDAGERDPSAVVMAGLAELTKAEIVPEYLELVSPDTLDPVASVQSEMLAVVAAGVGSTRLIDNARIRAIPASPDASTGRSLPLRPNEVATPAGAPTT
jgi:pantoate--beta-alanine ligase